MSNKSSKSMIRDLSRLISFRTLSLDKSENEKALDWIVYSLTELPLYVKRFSSDGFHSLMITTKKKKNPKIILAAHLDVVPGPDDVFKPRIKGDRLYGRGACDMKFAIACYMRLLRELKPLSSYDVGIMITSDEEIGGKNGTEYLLSKGYSADVAFLPDAGFNWAIEAQAKGVVDLEVVSKGKSAHAARAWEGDSAISNLINFLRELSGIFPKEPCGDEKHHHGIINIGRIAGGEALNQVAPLASAGIDIRHLPTTKKKKILLEISKIKDKYPGISIKEVISADPYAVDMSSASIKLYREIAKKKYKINPLPYLAHGSSDARFFAKKGIPALVVRPNAGDNHTDKEWISMKDLDRFYLVLKDWVESLH